MTQLHDRKHFLGGLNKDDDPAKLPEGDYQDGLNVRTQSSEQQHGVGPAETMQSEIEILIDVEAPAYYGGLAIGGDFIYAGYPEVQIGNQVWMKKNWDFNFPGSKVYNNDEANRAIYGGLYKWEHIQRANFCPTGWHIPTEAEVDELLEYLGGALIAGGRMKEPDDLHWNLPNNGADDFSGFKGLPGGMFDTIFKLLRQQAKFWINDEWNPPVPGPPPDEILRDYDGNPYSTVIINGREWIIENLRTTHYADGIRIPNIIGSEYNDWFLPSKDELNKIYTELVLYGLGGFLGMAYVLTSSEVNATDVWAQEFTLGSQINNMPKSNPGENVVAIRTFNGDNSYSIRDIGPSGYYIFHKIDNGGGVYTYYEAITASAHQWSNITNILIGTSTAIGTGQANTTAIISQAGHIHSAAKLCDDLTAGGWINDTNGAYCWYNNDIMHKETLGAYYSWYAVNNYHGLAYLKRNGVQEAGWRVATEGDWNNLLTDLGGDAIAGGKMKETGMDYWNAPNTGADNSSGLKIRGTGTRSHVTGNFDWFKQYAFIWASTEVDATHAYYIFCGFNIIFANVIGNGLKHTGHPVRLVRDV